jgi:hypothetical protein
MQQSRIVTLGFGTGRQKMALERWTNPTLSRRTCTCEYGLQFGGGKSAGFAKQPRERSPPPPKSLPLTIRTLLHRCTSGKKPLVTLVSSVCVCGGRGQTVSPRRALQQSARNTVTTVSVVMAVNNHTGAALVAYAAAVHHAYYAGELFDRVAAVTADLVSLQMTVGPKAQLAYTVYVRPRPPS